MNDKLNNCQFLFKELVINYPESISEVSNLLQSLLRKYSTLENVQESIRTRRVVEFWSNSNPSYKNSQ